MGYGAVMERPWLRQYEAGVPATLSYPDILLPQFLIDSARRYPNLPPLAETTPLSHQTSPAGAVGCREARATGLRLLRAAPGGAGGAAVSACFGGRHRASAVHGRHHRRTQRGDAHAPQPRRQRDPV